MFTALFAAIGFLTIAGLATLGFMNVIEGLEQYGLITRRTTTK